MRPSWTAPVRLLLGLAVFVTAGPTEAAWRPVPGVLRTAKTGDVSPTNAHPLYPRPQFVRDQWQNLNGLWEYAISGSSGGAPTNFDGEILVPFPVESALSGVGGRLWETNILWYRRSFQVPQSWAGQSVQLHFGAVDWRARVYLNGTFAGEHRGGYDPFSLDITRHLKWGSAEEILVAVEDPTEGEQPRGKQSRSPEGIFYTPTSGIWQTVWMEPVPASRIDALEMRPDASRGVLRVRALVNRLNPGFQVEFVARRQGTEAGRIRGPANSDLEIKIENPHLWTPDDPVLYDLRVTLFEKELIRDQADSYFGLRDIAVRKDATGIPRLSLNGESLFQLGVLDQGFWPDGLYAVPDESAWVDELTRLKRWGFNTVRKHVKVEPDRWYYLCDRLGLLVWQDMPSGNNLTAPSRRQFEIELERMVTTLRNHPSIVMWVLFNEGWGQYDTARLTAWLKTLDPSRLVNSASGWIDKRLGDVVDLHSYPGPEAPGVENSRASVLGEFGGLGLALPGHLWSPKTWGYEISRNPRQLQRRYAELLKSVWDLQETGALSAVIYTQISDVETECNGLTTYDRAVMKMRPDLIRSANAGKQSPGTGATEPNSDRVGARE